MGDQFLHLPTSPASYEDPSSKLRVHRLFDIWIEQVNKLLKYPYWLPIQRCQVTFYSEKLRSSLQAFPSFTLTGDPNSPDLSLFELKVTNYTMNSPSIFEIDKYTTEGGRLSLFEEEVTNYSMNPTSVFEIDKYTTEGGRLDFEKPNEPPDLNCVGDRLVLQVAEIYQLCMQVFGKTKDFNSPDPDFASQFYFDKKKFQKQLDEEVFVGFQEEASYLLKKLASITRRRLEVISIVGMAGLGLSKEEFIAWHFKDVSILWNTSRPIRALNISSIEFFVFPNELLQLVQLRYLELRFRSGNPPESISHLKELQTLIMSSRMNMVVPNNMWKMIKLRHLCIKSGENLVNISNVEEPSSLENLQTMSLVCPTRQCQHILARSHNLLNLGFCGSLTTKGGELKFPDIGFLMHLETLKLLNTVPLFRAGRLSDSILFPESLRTVSFSNTYLDWKEAWVFEMIPKLEVLKLKLHAFVGKDWKTSPEAFRRLKILKLDELDIVTWTASRNHFPVLQRLQVYQCPCLMEIPDDFGNICTLEWIELSGCSDAATESARDIQKEQESNGNDWLKILLNPGLIST
ncbi:hypothetical protein POM88_048303 [Heracleum sosnowskyi]|uniref:Disease resistance R13L4/SHOC-2-like LRR domain-containing protein n=1 Tax=Heracleum sosnowskyi TaxID=360622 RepID=A0AAD8GVH9_9APIA|nr:hypothetical protein POM88_048303 [Heracleum sosnowskyi]